MKAVTFQQRLDMFKGVGPGFDLLRIALSTLIILWHTIYICYGQLSAQHQYVITHWFFGNGLRALLPMFFCLSGFLVCGSALRLKSTGVFLTFRALRIVPALLMEVTLCAIILGGIFTTLPAKEYYTHAAFYKYFTNILGFVVLYLPGAFMNGPTAIVNVNLWTLPYEFYTYLILAAMLLTGVIFDLRNFMMIFVVASAMVIYALALGEVWDNKLEGHLQGWLVIYAFFIGALMFLNAERIPFSNSLSVMAAASLLLLKVDYGVFIGLIGACYLTIYLGLSQLPKLPVFKNGDYSYGLYLYGFPMTQMIWHALPALREWWLLFPCSYLCALGFSVVSWHYVEKPFLKLKNKLAFMKPPEPISPTKV